MIRHLPLAVRFALLPLEVAPVLFDRLHLAVVRSLPPSLRALYGVDGIEDLVA